MSELPSIASASYASSTVDPRMFAAANHIAMQQPFLGVQQGFGAGPLREQLEALARAQSNALTQRQNPPAKQEMPKMADAKRRLVQVFIADPDENVPLADCLLYKGEPKLTDLTDQELFFEVDIKTILDQHNVKRVALLNKAVKERTENLEPARIRDLRMTVVTIASF